MRVVTSALVALTALLGVVAGQALFGSYTLETETGIFTNFNYWLGQANGGSGPQQSIRVLEIGWAAPDPKTGTVDAINDIRNTWGWDGAVPVVTWMPYAYKTWSSPTPNDDIVSGLYDDYIDAFLKQLTTKYVFETATPKRLFLRFAPQPNGNWFPWSPYCSGCGQNIKQTADSYVKMWKYVIGKVRDPKYNLTSNVIQIIFNAATYSASGPVSSFLPSADTVDWFAMTGINWGTTMPGNSWVSPTDLFGPTLTTLRGINATIPIAIISAGSTSQPNGVAAKSEWLNEMCQFVISNKLKMYSYHNADTNTPQLADVGVFGGAVGPGNFSSPVSNLTFHDYPQYRTCVSNSANFIGVDTSNPRYISQSSFQGK